MGHSNTKQLVALLCGALCLAALALLGTGSAAQAQISCADQGYGWEVATAAEFNEAIACHNASPTGQTSNIILLADITADTTAGDAVFAPISGGDLIIIGEGHTLRRGASASSDPLPVLLFEHSGAALLGALDLAIEVGPHDTAGIEQSGPTWLRLVQTAIHPAPAGSAATGLLSHSGSITNGGSALVASSITDVPVGVDSSQVTFTIEASTIASSDTDIIAGGDGIGLVVNSTLGGPTGIRLDGAIVRVENATILGDGAATSATTPAGTTVQFRSSIANTCSGPIDDSGFNVGSCFAGSSGDPIELVLADNGCERPTPIGCAMTAALAFDSPALDAGLCIPGEAYEGDQRGFPRVPQGPGCDSGAFESGCIPGVFEKFVATAAQLSQAIVCHNFGEPLTRINLVADIEAHTVDSAAVFPEITGPGEFNIYGDGFTVRRGPDAGDEMMPLFAVSSESDQPFWLVDVGLEVGPYDTAGIYYSGSANLDLLAVSISASPLGTTATGIELHDGSLEQQVFLSESSIEGVPVGLFVQTQADLVLIGSSTIISTDIDIDVLNGGFIVAGNSTLGGPTGIRLSSGFVVAEHSTVLGDAIALGPEPANDPTMIFVSSIAATCSNPEIIETSGPFDDGNVGACFGIPTTTDAPADNGCMNPTATGCPRTAALPPGSTALGAGLCESNVTTDQRGEPRTPAGPGCDAGAFEAAFSPLAGDVDANGIVNNADVQAMLDWLAGGSEPMALPVGDMNTDGQVQLDDALALAQQVAG